MGGTFLEVARRTFLKRGLTGVAAGIAAFLALREGARAAVASPEGTLRLYGRYWHADSPEVRAGRIT